MIIILNGKTVEVQEGLTILDLLKDFNIKITQVAVELNGKIIQRLEYNVIKLKSNDKIEVVHFIGGG